METIIEFLCCRKRRYYSELCNTICKETDSFHHRRVNLILFSSPGSILCEVQQKFSIREERGRQNYPTFK